MSFRMKINGVEKQCIRAGRVRDGFERVIAVNHQGLNESEHEVPKNWLDINAYGVAVVGGTSYELVQTRAINFK